MAAATRRGTGDEAKRSGMDTSLAASDSVDFQQPVALEDVRDDDGYGRAMCAEDFVPDLRILLPMVSARQIDSQFGNVSEAHIRRVQLRLEVAPSEPRLVGERRRCPSIAIGWHLPADKQQSR